MSGTLGAGGFLNGGGPLYGARQGRRWCDVLYVVREAEFIEAVLRTFALRRLADWAPRIGAVSAAQHPHGGRFVPLNPRVVVTDDILVVQAGEQRHFTFDAPELLTGRVDLDALHSVVTAVQIVLNLEVYERVLLQPAPFTM